MRDEKLQQTHEKILLGARELLDTGAYSDLTMSRLATATAVAKSSLYRYYGTKEDVVLGVVLWICQQAEQEIVDAETARRRVRPAMLLLLEVHARWAELMPRGVHLYMSRLSDPVSDRIERTRQRLREAYGAVLRRGLASGEVQFGQPGVAAAAIVGGAEAAVAVAAPSLDARARGNAVRALGPMYLAGLGLTAPVEEEVWRLQVGR